MADDTPADTANDRRDDDDGGKQAKAAAAGLGPRDRRSVALLLLLYTLQGVPMGLCQSVAFILAEKKLPLSEQGVFSFASWPFSLKLLWAPIVDSLFIRRFGRRKSWLVPTQVALGLAHIWLGTGGTIEPPFA